MEKPVVTIGTVGAGYAAYLHGNGYEKVSGITVRLKAVCDLNLERAKDLQQRFGYEQAVSDYHELLRDPEIDVIDIVLPPFLHAPIATQAMEAGKHVICEKPLTGYFGEPGQENIGITVSKGEMYRKCLEEMDRLKEVVARTGKKFMYAENFVYATPVQKAAEIIRAKRTKLLFMKGEESLKGSSSDLAGRWNKVGGGTLMRTGTHPMGGMLWLKRQEAMARGEKITKDFGVITVTFSDGTKALCIASDTVLGGSRNYIEVYGNNTALHCNITPTDLLNTYFLDEDGLDEVNISEMLPRKLGWNKAFVSDEIIRGYMGELQDFVETVAYDRIPTSDFDLAYDTTKVIYAAYQSAEEGRRIDF